MGHLDAAGYQQARPSCWPSWSQPLADLRARFDVVVCEGAGSPAEINLLDGDIVNLRLARCRRLPAMLVGDIDRGGVFAALYGTVDLLPAGWRRVVQGFVINKFRGDPACSRRARGTGRRTGVPTLGVLPWLDGLGIDAEDSLALGRPVGPMAACRRGRGHRRSTWPSSAFPASPTSPTSTRSPRARRHAPVGGLAAPWASPTCVVLPGTKPPWPTSVAATTGIAAAIEGLADASAGADDPRRVRGLPDAGAHRRGPRS